MTIRATRPLRWALPVVAAALSLLVTVLPAAPAAAQNAATDINEESRQRSMAYFRMKVDPSTRARLSDEQLSRIENVIRGQINSIGRFEQVPLGVDVESPREFVEAFQAWLGENQERIAKMRSEDRGEEYDFRYASTIITGDAIRQALNSAYAYQIVVGPMRIGRATETYRARYEQVEVAHRLSALPVGPARLPQKLRHDQRTGNLVFISLDVMTDEERKAYLAIAGIDIDSETYDPNGGSGMQKLWHRAIDDLYRLSRSEPKTPRFEQRQGAFVTAEFSVSVTFVKIRIVDANDQVVPLNQAVQRVAGGSMGVTMGGRQEPGMYLLEPDTRTWLELMIANRRQLAAVRREQQRRLQVGERQAIDAAAITPILGIGTWVRTIQEFLIRAQVVEIGDGYVTQKPGRKEGLRVDDYSYIYSVGVNNRQIPVGWGLVTQLGPGYVASAEATSRADSAQTYVTLRSGNKPTRGDMIEEHAMFGVAVNVAFGGEFLLGSNASDPIGGDTLAEIKGGFTVALNPMVNVGRHAEMSQIWAGIDARATLGTDLLFFSLGLELKKKFHFGALGIDIAVSGGIQGFIIGSGTHLQAVANHLFGIGASASQAQANQVIADNNLTSPMLYYVAFTPRVEYFFSPELRVYIQLNVQLVSAAAESTIGAFTLDGSANRAFIPGFSWGTFGLGAMIGASFEF